jgi:Cu+-exporting ATPase
MNVTTNPKETVIDPVCGMSVLLDTTEISATVEGEIYYFCAESCRKSFVQNPGKFLNPKPEKKKGWWCRYTERLEKATGGKSIKCH